MKKQYWTLDRDQLEKLLAQQDLKRWWVAETAGVHRTTLRRWLKGEISCVAPTRVHALAKVFGVDRAEIAHPPN